MRDFTYWCPTEVIFGRDAELKTAEAAARHGGSRLLVVYGGQSAVRSGLLDRLCGGFKDKGLHYELLGGVRPNPRLGFVREGVKNALAMGADMIIGVGGGSAIDTAKAIAHGAANPETDVWDFWLRVKTVEKSLPVGAVLTVPAAGSETSDSAVITNETEGEKRGLSTHFNRPAFAIMNPALAATISRFQAACGVTDILMHTLERYFCPETGNAFTDEVAEALMRTVVRFGKRAVEDPADYEAMSELMWCGSVSHNGFTGLGGTKDFASHQLAHELGAVFDVAHGAALSSVWGSWASYVMGKNPARFAKYAKNVWGLEGAGAGIERTVGFFRELEMPTCLSDLGIGFLTDRELDRLALGCTYGRTRTIGSFMTLDYADIRSIYAAANM